MADAHANVTIPFGRLPGWSQDVSGSLGAPRPLSALPRHRRSRQGLRPDPNRPTQKDPSLNLGEGTCFFFFLGGGGEGFCWGNVSSILTILEESRDKGGVRAVGSFDRRVKAPISVFPLPILMLHCNDAVARARAKGAFSCTHPVKAF